MTQAATFSDINPRRQRESAPISDPSVHDRLKQAHADKVAADREHHLATIEVNKLRNAKKREAKGDCAGHHGHLSLASYINGWFHAIIVMGVIALVFLHWTATR